MKADMPVLALRWAGAEQMNKLEKRTFSKFIGRTIDEDRWIIEEVLPAYEAWKANPDNVYTTEQVFEAVDRAIDQAARKPER
jgi:hypothetical protein